MSYKYDYKKLMDQVPFSLGKMTNSKGQNIEFYEHPYGGDAFPVICVCHELEKAVDSEFFETDDMIADHGEYEPWFDENGQFRTGDLDL